MKIPTSRHRWTRNITTELAHGTGFSQWRTQEFCSGRGGVQKIQLRTEERENGYLGATAP